MEPCVEFLKGNCVHAEEKKEKAPPLTENLYSFKVFHSQSYEGNTMLHVHMIRLLPREDFCNVLMKCSPNFLNIKNQFGMTAMHLGAIMNEPLKVRELIVAGANPEITDDNGCTPLHYACAFGYDSVVVSLTKPFSIWEIKRMKIKELRILDLTRSLNISNNDGEVPLHLVAKYGSTNIMKLFIKHNLL